MSGGNLRLPDETVPDLWPEIERRLSALGSRTTRKSQHERRSPLFHQDVFRRVAAAVVAVSLSAAAIALAWNAFNPPDRESRQAIGPPLKPFSWEDLPEGWKMLPPPPQARTGAVAVWTGNELIYWGGNTGDGANQYADGYTFDPGTGEWRELASSPLEARSFAGGVWTGSEILIWGGSDETRNFNDGAAFDPRADTWRLIPPAPLSARRPLSVIWTGSEMIVWGSGPSRDDALRDGAAYDPRTNRWRTIAPAPVDLNDASTVWTGEEMIVFGANLKGGNVSDTEFAVGVAYNPATDDWRVLPPSHLSPQASTASWTGVEMVAWDYLLDANAYNPKTDEWHPLPRVPLEDYECTPDSAYVMGVVFGWYCGKAVTLSVSGERWQDVSIEALRPATAQLVAAGSVVLLLTDLNGETAGLWAYKPPAS